MGFFGRLVTYDDKKNSFNQKFFNQPTILGLDKGCPTFFHHEPTYKFSYCPWAAKRSSLYIRV